MAMLSHPHLKVQKGQATVEFVVACLVMVPLVLGIYYLVRYTDIKNAAIQSSRYAAFERAWDPTAVMKSDAVIQKEVRKRFFSVTDEKISKNGGNNTYPATTSVMWTQLNGNPLLEQHQDVVIRLDGRTAFTSNGVQHAIQDVGRSIFNLPDGGVIKAQVDVSLQRVAHFDALAGLDIQIPAMMAIGSGSWNASGSNNGSNSACDRVRRGVLMDYADGILDAVVDFGMGLFERSPPDFGIVRPDLVPAGSVNANNATTRRNVPVSSQSEATCEP